MSIVNLKPLLLTTLLYSLSHYHQIVNCLFSPLMPKFHKESHPSQVFLSDLMVQLVAAKQPKCLSELAWSLKSSLRGVLSQSDQNSWSGDQPWQPLTDQKNVDESNIMKGNCVSKNLWSSLHRSALPSLTIFGRDRHGWINLQECSELWAQGALSRATEVIVLVVLMNPH